MLGRNQAIAPLIYLLLAISALVWAAPASAATKKKRILYLGDSMSMGAFGETLDHEMRQEGFEVYTFVAGGATPYYWLSRYSTIKGPIGYWEKTPGSEHRQSVTKAVPKVETLMELYNPDVVIVQTGTNLYATLRSKRRSKENNVKEVEGLLNHMVEAATQGGRKCYWITPPDAHPGRYPTELQHELNEITKRVVSREAKVFDSSSVTKYTDPYPKTDGIHYGPTEARQWASYVAKDFRHFMGIDTGPDEGAGEPDTGEAEAEIPVNFDDIPRAIPVKHEPEPAVAEHPPVAPTAEVPAEQLPPEPKEAAADEVAAAAQAQVPSEPTEPEADRPPVQYVKKAIPLETEGVQWGRLDVEVKLQTKSELKNLKDIDYSYCFAVNEYEVLKVNSGYYPYDRIRVARVVMWGKDLKRSAIDEQVGFSPKGGWSLVPISRYPRFEQMQMVDALPFDEDLPIFIIALD